MGFGYKPDNKGPVEIPTVIGENPAVSPAVEKPLVTPDEELTDRKYVQDTFHNNTGVNVERFPNVVSDLKGFAEGSSVKVTYYKEHYSETDIKGRHATEESLDPTHKSVLKIFNFELRMTQALQYEHASDDHISKISGEAFTYPGFHPEHGDKFVYEVDVGKYGLFEIIHPPVRTSIRASTYFKIQFSLVNYMTNELKETLEKGVVATAYFDKARFLNEPGALLVHDEVVELKFLEKQRARIIKYYRQKFLDDKIMYSYMRPDNVYDPYVTDFLIKILDFEEAGTAAMQLYRDAPFYEESIWRAFLDDTVPLQAVPTSTTIAKHILGSKSVLANALTNKYYLKWIPSQNLMDYLKGLINEDEGGEGGEGEEGVIPPDPSVPELPDDEESDRMIGDILLHIHPHYTECPWVNGDDEESEGGTGDGLGYILGEGEQLALIAHFLLTREIKDLAILHRLIEKFWTLPKINQFYLGAVLIFLARQAISYIHHDNGIFEP